MKEKIFEELRDAAYLQARFEKAAFVFSEDSDHANRSHLMRCAFDLVDFFQRKHDREIRRAR